MTPEPFIEATCSKNPTICRNLTKIQSQIMYLEYINIK